MSAERQSDPRLARLAAFLRDRGRVVVAYSGGVDSALVLAAAVDTLGAENVLAVTGRSPSVASSELNDALSLASALGAEHLVIDTDEFENPNYLANPTNRCYFCKTTLYARLERVRAERGFDAVVNGVNADDLTDIRPGLKAADEFHVRAPLAELGLSKRDVRELAALLGLPIFDKPASPCLSSRVPYGEAITPEKLRMIEGAESFLHQLGFRECRVRHHDRLARIEVPLYDISRLADPSVRARVDDHFRSLGYLHVTLDLRGFRSGGLNEVIAFGKTQSAL